MGCVIEGDFEERKKSESQDHAFVFRPHPAHTTCQTDAFFRYKRYKYTHIHKKRLIHTHRRRGAYGLSHTSNSNKTNLISI